jgi:hypothetical protein
LKTHYDTNVLEKSIDHRMMMFLPYVLLVGSHGVVVAASIGDVVDE